MAQQDNIVMAVNRMIDVIGPNSDMYDDVMGAMGCEDAEAFADVFRAAGAPVAADRLIEQHSWHDEDGDQHYDSVNEAVHRRLHGLL